MAAMVSRGTSAGVDPRISRLFECHHRRTFSGFRLDERWVHATVGPWPIVVQDKYCERSHFKEILVALRFLERNEQVSRPCPRRNTGVTALGKVLTDSR